MAEIRRHTERYQDIARAREDGYVQASGMIRDHGNHFVNLRLQLLAISMGLDLSRPPALLYVERDGDWQLAGVEYALAQAPTAPGPIPPGRLARHEASCHYRDDEELEAPSAAACPPAHPTSGEPFVIWHPAMAVAHVWAWNPNPAGPFAPENAALAPWGGSRPSPRPLGSRGRLLQLNHRTSGALLLLIAVTTFWETRRPAPLPMERAVRAALAGLQRLPVYQRGSGGVATGAGIVLRRAGRRRGGAAQAAPR